MWIVKKETSFAICFLHQVDFSHVLRTNIYAGATNYGNANYYCLFEPSNYYAVKILLFFDPTTIFRPNPSFIPLRQKCLVSLLMKWSSSSIRHHTYNPSRKEKSIDITVSIVFSGNNPLEQGFMCKSTWNQTCVSALTQNQLTRGQMQGTY